MTQVLSGTVTAIASGLLGEAYVAFDTETDTSHGFGLGDLIRVEPASESRTTARPGWTIASIRHCAAEGSYRSRIAAVASGCAEASTAEGAVGFTVSPTVAHSLGQSGPGDAIRVSSLPFKLNQVRLTASALRANCFVGERCVVRRLTSPSPSNSSRVVRARNSRRRPGAPHAVQLAL